MNTIKISQGLLFSILFFIFIGATGATINRKPQPEETKLSLEKLMTISVSGVSKYEQSLEKAPASVIIITEQQIRNRCYSDLSDLLKDIPNIDITADAGRFGEYYTIRGIEGNDRFLVLIDGQKINPASGTFISIGNSLSLHFVKKVEIIFGPASAVYGADAFSGIINIVSRGNKMNSQLSLQAEIGSENRISGSIFYQGMIGSEFSMTGMARIFNSDGPDFTNRGYPEYDMILNRYKPPLNPLFEQPTKDHTLFLKFNYRNLTFSFFRQYFNEGNSLVMSPQFYVFNRAAKWAMESNYLRMVYDKSLNNGILTIDFSIISHLQNPETQFFKWKVVGQPKETFSQYMTGTDLTFRGIFSYSKKISGKLQFIAGIEYENTSSVPPYANDEVLGNSYQYAGGNIDLIKKNLTIEENRFAGFGQFILSVSKQLDLVVGGRYDHSSRYKGTFNQRMGIIINPTRHTTLKIIYGTAFQAPSLFYQFEQFGIPPFTFRSTNEIIRNEDPDWQLKNQRLETYEINCQHRLNERLTMQFSAYRNNLRDLIERVMYDTTGSTWNKYFNRYTNGQRNENIGRQKITGVNLTIHYQPDRNISAYAAYSYTDAIAKKAEADVPIARVAKHKIWAGIDIRNIMNHVSISPRFKWIGRRNTTPTNTLYAQNGQPGYLNCDLSLTVHNLLKRTRFHLFLGNLFNSHIEHAGLYGQSGIYPPIIPQPGFHFRFGFSYHYQLKQ